MGACCKTSQIAKEQYITPDGGVYQGELKEHLPVLI